MNPKEDTLGCMTTELKALLLQFSKFGFSKAKKLKEDWKLSSGETLALQKHLKDEKETVSTKKFELE